MTPQPCARFQLHGKGHQLSDIEIDTVKLWGIDPMDVAAWSRIKINRKLKTIAYTAFPRDKDNKRIVKRNKKGMVKRRVTVKVPELALVMPPSSFERIS